VVAPERDQVPVLLEEQAGRGVDLRYGLADDKRVACDVAGIRDLLECKRLHLHVLVIGS